MFTEWALSVEEAREDFAELRLGDSTGQLFLGGEYLVDGLRGSIKTWTSPKGQTVLQFTTDTRLTGEHIPVFVEEPQFQLNPGSHLFLCAPEYEECFAWLLDGVTSEELVITLLGVPPTREELLAKARAADDPLALLYYSDSAEKGEGKK